MNQDPATKTARPAASPTTVSTPWPSGESAARVADLVVDLDDTLMKTDSLIEQCLLVLFRHPACVPGVLIALKGGRARFKRRLSAAATLDYGLLPYDPVVLDFIWSCRAGGSRVHLVTAADQSMADGVSAAVGVFDTATGSDGAHNLKGPAKAAYLETRFPGGFGYIGDSRADLHVWKRATPAVVVTNPAKLRRLEREGLRADHVLPRPSAGLRDWSGGLRLRRWWKNALILLPLVLPHPVGGPAALVRALAGFLLFGVLASSAYLINDLSDLASDRAHPARSRRPLATGLISAPRAAALALSGMGLGLAGAIALSPGFGGVAAVFLAIGLTYSFGLKRISWLGGLAIGGLFTARLAGGLVLSGRDFPGWILPAALVAFTLAAIAKRRTETVRTMGGDGDAATRGGYIRDDTP